MGNHPRLSDSQATNQGDNFLARVTAGPSTMAQPLDLVFYDPNLNRYKILKTKIVSESAHSIK